MARGKRSRAREEASEEEATAPEFVEEAEEKRVHEDKGEGAGKLEEKEEEAGRELVLSDCKTVLKHLMEHKHGWLFNEPVDPKKLDIPDYPSVVKHPMDLGTIESKLDRKEYGDIALEFANAVQLTFDNAMLYNPPGHEVHNCAKKLKALFEKEWSKKRAKMSTPPKTPVQALSFKALSFEEKQILLENLQTLPPNMQYDAVMLMTEKSPHVDWSGDEVDVQLDLMDNQTLHELDAHVKKCMKTATSTEKRGKQTMGSNRARSKGKQQKGKQKPGDEEEDIGIVIDVPVLLFSAQKVK